MPMIDPAKLAAWRQRFSNDRPHQTEGDAFRKAAALGFSEAGRRKLPYAGLPTLLGAPHRPEAADLPDFGGLQVALIGVPMDLAVTNRAGARLGPRAIRNIERIGPFHHAHGIAPMAELRVADVGDVPFRSRFSLEQSLEDIEAFVARVVAAGVRPLSAGGDHSISYPILRAVGRDRPVGLVHIDAHCDTSGVYEGSRFHHGGPFRQAVLDGVLDPARTIQIGIRGGGEYLWEFSFETGMTVIHADELDTMGLDAVIARARQVVGEEPFYVSFDVDGIDPAFTPGTGTPEVGGLTPREAQRILRGLAGLNIVGGDVVEVAPQYDTTTVTAQIGAQMMFEILALLALAPRR
jgi:guanidinopropionase